MDPITLFALANGAVSAVKAGCKLYKDLIKVATIPYAALGLYSTHSIKQDIRDKILKEYGLEKEPSDESADEGGWDDRTLHHKYYDVNYEYL